jgi:hypothetical protein
METRFRDSKIVDANRSSAIAGLNYALRRLPVVRVVWSDGDTRVTCNVGMSGWSWGERLTMRFGDDGELSVESVCRFPLQLFDWGKNERNVELIYEWIGEYLELFAQHRLPEP